MNLKRLAIVMSVGTGTIITLALLWLIGSFTTPITAASVLNSVEGPVEHLPSDVTPIHYVTITGTDSGDCSIPTGACQTIQYAVDRAGGGDEIRVATGVYTGVQTRPAPSGYTGPAIITQVVHISKSLTVRGGYTVTDWSTSNPISYPTTLDAQGDGRVLFITGDINATVEGLQITSGNAYGLGGLDDSDTGGGIYVVTATATIHACKIYSNSAVIGGGVHAERNTFTLTANVVSSNTAQVGGGIVLFLSTAKLDSNIINFNDASDGGGLWLYGNVATLDDNLIAHNDSAADGGGLSLNNELAWLNGNTIISNTSGRYGGGIAVWYGNATLDNNVIANNSGVSGSGLNFNGSENVLLRHNTIAHNIGGDGHGIRVYNGSNIVMSNTILVSHTVGIFIDGGMATLEATLWGNETDWDDQGNITTGTINLWGNAAFVDPALGDYHIQSDSIAVDAGINADVTSDADGDPRPASWGFDLGADERPGPSLLLHKTAQPLLLNPGQTITYMAWITSVGSVTATNVMLSEVIPAYQRALTITTSRGSCTPQPEWGSGATCDLGTMVPGAAAHITLTAQVTTTVPPTLPQHARSTVWATATETSNTAHLYTYFQNCHARLNDVPIEYTTIQSAIDASAASTDMIKVAGVCAGVNERGELRQQVYLSRTLTIQGGWNTLFTQHNAVSYPTTLDVQGKGRVLYIAGDISPTIEGLRITGGNTTGLGGRSGDSGGGVYIIDATAILSDNQVFGNSARQGGGLYLDSSPSTLVGNIISANTAYDGGGLYLYRSDAILNANTIYSNTADVGGGGVYLFLSPATLDANTIISNFANSGGGGLYLDFNSHATLNANTIAANKARWWGGGLYLDWHSVFTLTSNTIISNTAYNAGGLFVFRIDDARLINNVVADNQSTDLGSGLYVNGSSIELLHNTIAHNTGGDGIGIYVTGSGATFSTVAMANTILVSHTVGMHVSNGNTAMLESTLWNGNTSNWDGTGVIERNNDYSGNPIFTSPDRGDYHIDSGSAAIDKGVDAEVTTDIDGDPRPTAFGFDLGADELRVTLTVTKQAIPNPVQPGAPLTYTVQVINTGSVDLNATITDTLPNHVTPTGALTWTPIITAHGGVWTQTVVVTVDLGYVGPLTNIVQVTTLEGATGIYTHTLAPDFDIAKYATPEPVQAGERLTYTIALTNTGNFDLHATVTDTPSVHVTPIGTLTWTPTIPAPDGVWTQTVVVTVALDYEGVVTNVVQVTSAEGTTGAYTRTTTVEKAIAGLQVVNDSPTALGQATRLTATVTASSNAVYTWNFGDDSMLLIIGETTDNGAVVTHVYPDAGIYTAVVTASNGVSVITATTPITIYRACCVRLNDGLTSYPTIQAAVDASTHPTDVVKVAGYCSDVHVRSRNDVTTTGVVTQVVYISKTLTLQGGWNISFTQRNVISYPTTLDAQGQGRLLYITGDISPTIEGLRITGGNANGLGGGPWGWEAGGGVYVITATAIIKDNQIFNNTAYWYGGGLYLVSSDAILTGNTVTSNTAERNGGGGIYLRESPAVLSGNTVISNTASEGGGLFLLYSPATLSGNVVFSNTGVNGGGLFLDFSGATLNDNDISFNSAYVCGGLCVNESDATLTGNTVFANTARGAGGGLLAYSDNVILSGNTVLSNTADRGGGLFLVRSNVKLTNNVIADNWANSAGGGLYIEDSSSWLSHNTISRNSSGDGSGMYVTNYWSDLHSVAILTNTILASHSVGISVTGGNTVVVNGILWHNTPITISQAVTATVTAQNQHTGDPAFVDPDAENYHIGVASAATDMGVDAGVSDDINGDPRPMGRSPDLGADELGIAMVVSKQATPDPVQSGTPLTYTIQITNNGLVTLTAAVTDTLLPGETSSGALLLSDDVLTWTNITITPGNVWMTQFTITVGAGYAGTLTNVVQVTTDEGARATVTETAFANIAPVADAGPDLYVVESDAVLLDGSGSTDPDGHLPLAYRWKRTGGPFIILVDADKAQAAFQSPPYQSALTFTLTVTDSLGLSSEPDTIIVYVGIEPPSNQSPYTPSNPNPRHETINIPLTQTLNWRGGDPDDQPVTYTLGFGDISPPPVVVIDLITTTYDPGLLLPHMTYYWAVTATDGISITRSAVWRFTTVTEYTIYLPIILHNY